MHTNELGEGVSPWSAASDYTVKVVLTTALW